MDTNNLSTRTAITIALIAAVPSTIAALAAYNKADDTHQLVNSRMTEMLKIVSSEAAAKATLAEKAKEEQKEVVRNAIQAAKKDITK